MVVMGVEVEVMVVRVSQIPARAGVLGAADDVPDGASDVTAAIADPPRTAPLPFASVTPCAMSRALFITSADGGGFLYELDMEAARAMPNVSGRNARWASEKSCGLLEPRDSPAAADDVAGDTDVVGRFNKSSVDVS